MSDRIGRRPFIVATLLVQLISLVIMSSASDLYMAIFATFLLGLSHPGKNIVMFNYCVEMCPEGIKKQVVNFVLLIEAGAIVFIAASYQYLSKSWHFNHYISIAFTSINLIMAFLAVSESPKFLHQHKRYEESRETLEMMALFNKASYCEAIWKAITFTQSSKESRDPQLELADQSTDLVPTSNVERVQNAAHIR